ncbi:MAG: hypothetical protein LBD80_08385 [Tannerella sp.]|nr:hypothetical protein [Tannerella sp.]
MNKNIALVELGGSHSECMHLQIKALKEAGYRVFLICNASLCDDFPDKTLFDGLQTHHDTRSLKCRMKIIMETKKFLKRNNISTVVFNTVEISLIRNLTVFSPCSTASYIGVVHNGRYLENSASCRIISRKVKKFFVLSHFIKEHLNIRPGIEVGAFYPVYYPPYGEANIAPKKSDEIWIIVPGAISPQKKDLDLLLNALERNRLHPWVRIILLGRIDAQTAPQHARRIAAIAQSNNITTFSDRVRNDVFHTYMKHADLVMPLIHADNYGAFRISGAYNLARGYKTPLLLEEEQKNCPDFERIALFYDKSQDAVMQINALAENRAIIKQCKEFLRTHPDCDTQTQCRAYIEFITK